MQRSGLSLARRRFYNFMRLGDGFCTAITLEGARSAWLGPRLGRLLISPKSAEGNKNVLSLLLALF